jgi:hypothetical protein
MKTLRKPFYVAVAGMTLAFGIGAVAAVRIAYAAASRLATSQVTTPVAEPVTVTPVLAQPVVVESAIDESCGGLAATTKFDPTGDYALELDKVPRPFSDLENLTLETREYVEQDGEFIDRPIVPRGSIQTKRELKLTRIALGDHQLAFQTETVNGVSYRFVGQFLSIENYGEAGSMPDLKGRLIKIRSGKWAAEMEAEFYLQCGC